MKQRSRREIPAVNKLLDALGKHDLATASKLPRPLVVDLVRRKLSKARSSGQIQEFGSTVKELRHSLELFRASRLQQVIINLALNARDAVLERQSPPVAGPLGHITLRVAANEAGGAVLIVEDDGPGIPEHVLARLFEPFFTTKPAGKGTGLGLAAVQTIVSQCGGWIEVDTVPGEGTTFSIGLPTAEAA